MHSSNHGTQHSSQPGSHHTQRRALNNPMRYIIRRGAGYHLHWGVPKDIRHLFGGRSAITRSLSSDLATALVRRDLAIGELSKVLQAARGAEEGHEFTSFIADIRKKLPQLQPAQAPTQTPVQPVQPVQIQPVTPVPAPEPIPEPIPAPELVPEPITARKGLLLKEAVRLYIKETDLSGSMVSRLKMAPALLLKHLSLKDIHLSDVNQHRKMTRDQRPKLTRASWLISSSV